MFDAEFCDQLAKALTPRLVELLTPRVTEGLKNAGIGTQQKWFTREQAAAYIGTTKNGIREMLRDNVLAEYAPEGNVRRARLLKEDLDRIHLEYKQYVGEREKAARAGKDADPEENDMWEQLVTMFYDYLPPVPRSAFIDDAAHEFYKNYRWEMTKQACIDPFSDTMSRIMDEIKEAVSEANRQEEQAALTGMPVEKASKKGKK